MNWLHEAKYVAENPRDTWLLVRGRSGTINRFLDVMSEGSIVTAYSTDELVLAILFYNVFDCSPRDAVHYRMNRPY
jgi:hypothetical protein